MSPHFLHFTKYFLMVSLLWFPFRTSCFYEKCFQNPFLVLFSERLSHCGGSAETQMREINCLCLIFLWSWWSVSSQDSQLVTIAMGCDGSFFLLWLCVCKCCAFHSRVLSRNAIFEVKTLYLWSTLCNTKHIQVR